VRYCFDPNDSDKILSIVLAVRGLGGGPGYVGGGYVSSWWDYSGLIFFYGKQDLNTDPYIVVQYETPIRTGNLNIAVIDETGNPISGVIISSNSQPENQEALYGMSNSNGEVNFTGILFGSYLLKVSKNGYDTNVTTVLIREDRTKSSSIILKKEMCTVKITIEDENSVPITGVTVQTITKPNGQKFLTNYTNSEGIITFYEIQSGIYSFQASKNGYISDVEHVSTQSGEELEVLLTLRPLPVSQEEQEINEEQEIRGIPGFPLISMITGLIGSIFILYILRNRT